MDYPQFIAALQQQLGTDAKEVAHYIKVYCTLVKEQSMLLRAIAIPKVGIFLPHKVEEYVEVDEESNQQILYPPAIKLHFVGEESEVDHLLSQAELVALFVEKGASTHAEAQGFLEQFAQTLSNELADSNEVEITALGTFKPLEFQPAESLSQAINAPFALFAPELLNPEAASTILQSTAITSKAKERERVKEEENTPATPPVEQVAEAQSGKTRSVIWVIPLSIATALLLYWRCGNHVTAPPPVVVAPPPVAVAIEEEEVDSAVVEVKDTISTPPTSTLDTIDINVFMTTLAQKHYGHKSFWVYIYEENKTAIPNPRQIAPKREVRIPAKEKYNIDANNPQSIKAAKALAKKLLKQLEQRQ